MDLEPGTRVLITGASRGIGRAMSEAFAARRCALGLVSRSEDELRELAERLPGSGHQALPADVGDAEAVSGAIERFGAVDVLVANAGVADYGPFVAQPLEQVERMTHINWLGTVYTIRAALPGMLDRRRGHLVVVSSGAGLRSFPQAAVYGATKAAQHGFAEALWHELAGTGVDVTIVYPGEVRSELHGHERDSMPAWREMADEADPADLARKVVDAVEHARRAVYFPPLVRALRTVHGISPRASDLAMRRLRGVTAAPRVG